MDDCWDPIVPVVMLIIGLSYSIGPPPSAHTEISVIVCVCVCVCVRVWVSELVS